MDDEAFAYLLKPKDIDRQGCLGLWVGFKKLYLESLDNSC